MLPMTHDEGLPEEEIIQVLYLDPNKEEFEKIRARFTEWFGEYLRFTWYSAVEDNFDEVQFRQI